MDLQIEKLQKDITDLMKSAREIEKSDIPECLKNIKLRFISKLISKIVIHKLRLIVSYHLSGYYLHDYD